MRPVASGRLLLVKNSGVPPTTCTPWSTRPPTLSSLAFSQISGPTCLASGNASRSCSACATVILFRASTSADSGPKLKLGHFWVWNTPAPSCPIVLSSERCSPSRSAIIAMTVKTPMTMPSRVRNERSLCADSVASESRKSSERACVARASRARSDMGAVAGAGPVRTASLIAERLDGMQERRAQRRPDAEDRAEQDRPDAAADDHSRIDAGGERRQHVDQLSRSGAHGNADESAHRRDHHRLAQELQQNRGPPRAESAPHADLAGALLH